jgi:hypothetical protein
MLKENADLIFKKLRPEDTVLDIGGWAHPFNRANYVMDAEPYETRGYYNRTFAKNNPFPPIGGDVEFFTKETWLQRDICDKQPFPFKDKELDYVICSHTLEDIRDPLWVCSEIVRIGKAGYIEVPSRILESCRGQERGIAGLSHHRWLIEITSNSIVFLQKFHRIHNWQYSLPKSVQNRLSACDMVQSLFWEVTFEFAEKTLHGQAQLDELEGFVNKIRPYPRALLVLDDVLRQAASLPKRGVRKILRVLARNAASRRP